MKSKSKSKSKSKPTRIRCIDRRQDWRQRQHMPGTDGLEDAPDIATHPGIQTIELAADLDSPFFATTPDRQGAAPKAQIELDVVGPIFQRALVPEQLGVVVEGNLLDQSQQRTREHVVDGFRSHRFAQLPS